MRELALGAPADIGALSSTSRTVGSVTAELARADVGWTLLAMLRTVTGREDIGASAVDQLVDRRAG